ncbi:MAG: hypothetical protein H0X38_00465, partial [Planctomycetes bacterium]|nr:hypothetical protein [Planctomycetota bacterium]
HRPIGLMMLCAAETGWAHNPRGWFSDPLVDTATPAGVAAFHQRLEVMIDVTIVHLTEMGAQGVVFWDLEGRATTLSYVGDPRQLGRLAPEMDSVADRIFSRLRNAGFSVGVALRAQEATAASAGLVLRPVADPARLLQAKIDYAQRRWGATIFPVLGDSGGVLPMATICRRVGAASPGLLLMPSCDGGEAYRWSAPWQDARKPTAPQPADARRTLPGAFGAFAEMEPEELARRRDELVQAVTAGDILTFRAWYADPAQPLIRAIYAAAARK